jgi:hypothetical protein
VVVGLLSAITPAWALVASNMAATARVTGLALRESGDACFMGLLSCSKKTEIKREAHFYDTKIPCRGIQKMSRRLRYVNCTAASG